MESSVLSSLFFSSEVINESDSKSGIFLSVSDSSIIILNKVASVDAIDLIIVKGSRSFGEEFLTITIKLYISVIVVMSKVQHL